MTTKKRIRWARRMRVRRHPREQDAAAVFKSFVRALEQMRLTHKDASALLFTQRERA